MTNKNEFHDTDAIERNGVRIAYIKPTGAEEATRLGIMPAGIRLPDDVKLYVLHSVDGTVLGYTDSWDTAYGAAIQNELTPVSVH